MAISIGEEELKDLIKSAVISALEERRDLVKEILTEVIEDVALAKAINEGMSSEAISRAEVFEVLEQAR